MDNLSKLLMLCRHTINPYDPDFKHRPIEPVSIDLSGTSVLEICTAVTEREAFERKHLVNGEDFDSPVRRHVTLQQNAFSEFRAVHNALQLTLHKEWNRLLGEALSKFMKREVDGRDACLQLEKSEFGKLLLEACEQPQRSLQYEADKERMRELYLKRLLPLDVNVKLDCFLAVFNPEQDTSLTGDQMWGGV